MRYIVEEKVQLENGEKHWIPLFNKEGFTKVLSSKAEARNYLHDKGYTINSPDILLVEVR